MTSLGYIIFLTNLQKNKIPSEEKLQKMGVIPTKIAKWYAKKIDIITDESSTKLVDIHTSAIKAQPIHMLKMLDKNDKIFGVLEYFDNEPVGSTYLYQLYRACLRNGNDILIKIYDEKAKNKTLKDIANARASLNFLRKWNSKLYKKLLIEEVFDAIEADEKAKLSFEFEAENNEFMKKVTEENRIKYNLSRLVFPKIYFEYMNDKYLIREYLLGHTMYEKMERKELTYEKLLEAIRYHFFFVFVIGKYHENINSRNVIFTDDIITFVNCNLMIELSEKVRINLLNFMLALLKRDVEETEKEFYLMSNTIIGNEKKHGFRGALVLLFREFERKTIQKMFVSQLIMKTTRVAMSYGFELERELQPFIASFIRVENIAKKINDKRDFSNEIILILENYKSKIDTQGEN